MLEEIKEFIEDLREQLKFEGQSCTKSVIIANIKEYFEVPTPVARLMYNDYIDNYLNN